jgi:hypothetical protein
MNDQAAVRNREVRVPRGSSLKMLPNGPVLHAYHPARQVLTVIVKIRPLPTLRCGWVAREEGRFQAPSSSWIPSPPIADARPW